MSEPYTYKGLNFTIQCSGLPQGDGRYHAALRYAENGLDISLHAAAPEYEEVMRRLKTKTAPRLYKEVITALPLQDKALVDEITFPVFWELWKGAIFAGTGWAETTFHQRENLLYGMFRHLPDLPLRSLKLEQIIEAAALATCGKADVGGATVTQLRKYRDTVNLAAMAIDRAALAEYFDDNILRAYAEKLKRPKSDTAPIRQAFRQDALDAEIEAALYAYICDELGKNGMMFGVALMLLAGLTAAEACALQFKDITGLAWMDSNEPVYIINVAKIRGKDKKDASPTDPASYRRVPMHRQLAELYEKHREETLRQLANTKNPNIDNTYLVRAGKKVKGGVQPQSLNNVVTRLLKQLGVAAPPEIPRPDSGNITLSVNHPWLLRRNFIYRLELNTGMTADELNYLTGRAVRGTDAKYYRDWAADACMLNLKAKMDRWNIALAGDPQPEIVRSEQGLLVQDTGGSALSLAGNFKAKTDGYYEIVIRTRRGANVSGKLGREVE